LKNGVAEVEYNNMAKLIHPNETLYDVITMVMTLQNNNTFLIYIDTRLKCG